MNKKELRTHYKQLRGDLLTSEKQRYSQHICDWLLSLPIIKDASSIAGFLPSGNEPDILPLLIECAKTKTIYLPAHTTDHYEFHPYVFNSPLTKGPFGIDQPELSASETRLDVILVPGVAFDRQGNRIGHGKGIYDRLLARCSGATIGVGFDCQLGDAFFPKEEWDIPLNYIVTNQCLITLK